jgi:outer membrane lipoprotein SlyB
MPHSTIFNRFGRSVLCVVLLAVTGPKVGAQSGAMPAFWQGARLRVTSPALGPQRRVVTLLRQHADTIVVRVEGRSDSTVLRSADISRLELSRGAHTQVRKGLIIGAISGAVLGAVITYASYKEPDCTNIYGCIDSPIETRSTETAFGAIGGGVLGGLVGAGVGAVWKVENWEYFRIPGAATGLRVVPTRSGIALSAAF